MRALHALTPAVLCLPLAALALQEGGEGDPEQETPGTGLGNFFKTEQVRLEEGLEGVWRLMAYETPLGPQEMQNMEGYAFFQDGFHSLTVSARTYNDEFLGDGLQLYVQGGVYSYRIDENLRLQTAAMLGFHNTEDVDTITYESGNLPREYEVELGMDKGSLSLRRPDGTVLRFARMQRVDFPEDALRRLNLERSGLYNEEINR